MTTMESIPYQELEIGATADYEKSLTEEDLVLFAATSGDVNPVHLDEAYAADTLFKQNRPRYVVGGTNLRRPGDGDAWSR